jgi:murein DD-endopeptidase MepM/ murein hydrolase activator NlpD
VIPILQPIRIARPRRMSTFVLFFCALLPASAATWTARTQPSHLVNGAPLLFEVKAPAKFDSLSGTWLGHQLTFNYDASTKSWTAFAGVSLETTPGSYALELTGERATTKQPVTFVHKFTVARAKYPKIKVALTVEKKFTEPTPEQLKEIEDSKKVKQDYLNRVTPDREWNGKFTAPADAAISDVFGSERIFNGKAGSPHQGLDFRVPTGTPVAAMNNGTVLLARPLYYEGGFIVLDHGQGLLTLYLHLSEFKVKEGDLVERGQIIALSGGTGRATGPHLHVAVRWQGAYLDPARLMQLSLPKGEAKTSPQATGQLPPRAPRSLAQSLIQSIFQRQIAD